MDQSDADHRGVHLVRAWLGAAVGQSRMRDWLSNILNITIPEPTLESRIGKF
jgi:hypothetical protein